MKEVSWSETPIPKAEFIFAREFMMMDHNYLCAVCKEKPAVQDTSTGILQPCWDCGNAGFQVVKVNWFSRLLFGWHLP